MEIRLPFGTLAEAETPPFLIEENSERRRSLRLKYRYSDLRRPDSSEESG